MAQRAADYGVWVVPSEETLPARAPALREIGGDKLFVVYDPEDGSRLALEVAYSLARARVLMAKGGVEGLDAPALRAEVERALGAMDEVRRIKLHLTNAAGGIEQARSVLEGMAERVRAHLAQIGALVDCGGRRGTYAEPERPRAAPPRAPTSARAADHPAMIPKASRRTGVELLPLQHALRIDPRPDLGQRPRRSVTIRSSRGDCTTSVRTNGDAGSRASRRWCGSKSATDDVGACIRNPLNELHSCWPIHHVPSGSRVSV